MPVYYDTKGKYYYVRVYITDIYGIRKQKRLSPFNSKTEAKNAEAEFILKNGEYSEIKNMKFSDLIDEYLEYKKVKLKSQSFRKTKSNITNHILPYFKNFKISEIDQRKYTKWQQAIEELNYSHKYNSSLHGSMVNIMQYACDFCRLDRNIPLLCGNFKRKNDIVKKASFWTYEEYIKFIDSVDDLVYKRLFETLYYTGMRIGECLALNWHDLDDIYINVNKTISKELDKRTKQHIINTPKTRNSIRKIEIDKTLQMHLLELKNYYKEFIGFSEDWFIFGGLNPLSHTTVGRRHKEYCEKAKVKKIKIHDIRHSHASLLISIKTPITTISERLGHSDTQLTLNTYIHMFPKDEDKAVSNIEKLRKKYKF